MGLGGLWGRLGFELSGICGGWVWGGYGGEKKKEKDKPGDEEKSNNPNLKGGEKEAQHFLGSSLASLFAFLLPSLLFSSPPSLPFSSLPLFPSLPFSSPLSSLAVTHSRSLL